MLLISFFFKDISQEYTYLKLNTYKIYTKTEIPKFTAKLREAVFSMMTAKKGRPFKKGKRFSTKFKLYHKLSNFVYE